MKNRLFLLILSVFALSVMAEKTPSVKILLEDGTSHFFLLEDNPKACFVGDTLVITSKNMEVCINLGNSEVVQVMYVNDYDDIHELKDGFQFVYRFTDYGLEANGLRPNTIVYVYDIKGVLIARTPVRQDGSLRVPLKDKGVFIIKTSVSSIIIKK